MQLLSRVLLIVLLVLLVLVPVLVVLCSEALTPPLSTEIIPRAAGRGDGVRHRRVQGGLQDVASHGSGPRVLAGIVEGVIVGLTLSLYRLPWHGSS
jgi:hypothetical protein